MAALCRTGNQRFAGYRSSVSRVSFSARGHSCVATSCRSSRRCSAPSGSSCSVARVRRARPRSSTSCWGFLAQRGSPSMIPPCDGRRRTIRSASWRDPPTVDDRRVPAGRTGPPARDQAGGRPGPIPRPAPADRVRELSRRPRRHGDPGRPRGPDGAVALVGRRAARTAGDVRRPTRRHPSVAAARRRCCDRSPTSGANSRCDGCSACWQLARPRS
jgi:hypothetical protein